MAVCTLGLYLLATGTSYCVFPPVARSTEQQLYTSLDTTARTAQHGSEEQFEVQF